jgi:hypothetical protein
MRPVVFSLREAVGLAAALSGVAVLVALEMVERALVVLGRARAAGAAVEAWMRAAMVATALDEEAIAIAPVQTGD